MSGNSVFERVEETGWQAGLKNLMRAENRRWWKTRTWWVQSLIWIGVVDFILLMIVMAIRSEGEPADPEELVLLYGIFGGMFASIGVVVQMQGAIVGEKISGTAAWVLSKPISRAAFVLSKLLSNTFGVAVTGMLIPGLIAYLIITQGAGQDLSFLKFLGGMGILFLFASYFLSLTLMLGAFFKSRGPVIGIPLAIIMLQQFLLGLIAQISPKLIYYVPFLLVMPMQEDGASSVASSVIFGMSPDNWIPVYSSLIMIVVFLVVGIWRFSREEF